MLSDESAFVVASLSFVVLGALNAVLVVRVGRRLGFGRAGALLGGLFYATWFGAVGAEFLTKLEPLGNFVFLCATPGGPEGSASAPRAGRHSGGLRARLPVSIKIWWIVPAVGLLVWHAVR